MEILGIDVGGTGIKGAPVDTATGALAGERLRILTPQPATPEAVIDTMAQIVKHFKWTGPVGCGFPAVIKDGSVHTAANIDPSWIGVNIRDMMAQATGQNGVFLNDADAAGMAEMRFGAGKDREGLVLILTLGTGIGTSLFINGQLVPNTELGHIEIRGKDAEKRASERVRIQKKLNWKKWARRVDEYLCRMEALLWPDLIIIGGGASKKHDRFFPYFKVKAETVPAQLLNEAGIIGAALAAEPQSDPPARPTRPRTRKK